MSSDSPIPDPEVLPKTTRRHFVAASKPRILDEYDAAGDIEKAAICRREGVYSSLLSKWRKRRATGKTFVVQPGRRPIHRGLSLLNFKSAMPRLSSAWPKGSWWSASGFKSGKNGGNGSARPLIGAKSKNRRFTKTGESRP